ncbi:MAG TPA: ADP-ribose diphosphatase [Rhodospirillaceae bacterium]|nr:ADP-ribose diphosphatase [Rhodospirillaceae bacterium]
MEKKFKILSKTECYSGYLKLHLYSLDYEGFSGNWLHNVPREVVENGVAVVVLPYDPVRNCVVVTEQFRIGALAAGRDPWVLGFVAGMMSPEETQEDVARREGEEEIGCPFRRLVRIGAFMPSPGTSSELVHVYVGEADSSAVGEICGVAHEQEDIKVSVLSVSVALERFAKGDFISAGSVIAMQWFAGHHEQLGREWRAQQDLNLRPQA